MAASPTYGTSEEEHVSIPTATITQATSRVQALVERLEGETADGCGLCGFDATHDADCPVPHLKRALRRLRLERLKRAGGGA